MTMTPPPPRHALRRAGLTLVELLVVLAILAMLAATTVSMAGSTDAQLRFEDTRARLATLRRGVAGTPDVVANGQPLVNGFVADMGRLPASVRELLDPPADAGPPPRPWSFMHRPLELPGVTWASPAGVAAGWRGPYLPAVRELDGRLAFRDGWGAPDQLTADPQCGWSFAAPPDGTLVVRSLGANVSPGGDPPYDADYPAAGTSLLEPVDYAVDLGASPLVVTFLGPAPLGAPALRLRVYSHRTSSAGGASWVFEDSAPQTVLAGELQASFSFAASTWMPCGQRLLVVVEDAPLAEDRPPHAPILNTPQPLTLVPRVSLPLGAVCSWRLE